MEKIYIDVTTICVKLLTITFHTSKYLHVLHCQIRDALIINLLDVFSVL